MAFANYWGFAKRIAGAFGRLVPQPPLRVRVVCGSDGKTFYSPVYHDHKQKGYSDLTGNNQTRTDTYLQY